MFIQGFAQLRSVSVKICSVLQKTELKLPLMVVDSLIFALETQILKITNF